MALDSIEIISCASACYDVSATAICTHVLKRLNYAARTLRLKRSTSLACVGMNELLDGMLLMLLAGGEECVNVLFRVQVALTEQSEHLDATFFDALD
jgi:hypothetical protein